MTDKNVWFLAGAVGRDLSADIVKAALLAGAQARGLPAASKRRLFRLGFVVLLCACLALPLLYAVEAPNVAVAAPVCDGPRPAPVCERPTATPGPPLGYYTFVRSSNLGFATSNYRLNSNNSVHQSVAGTYSIRYRHDVHTGVETPILAWVDGVHHMWALGLFGTGIGEISVSFICKGEPRPTGRLGGAIYYSGGRSRAEALSAPSWPWIPPQQDVTLFWYREVHICVAGPAEQAAMFTFRDPIAYDERVVQYDYKLLS